VEKVFFHLCRLIHEADADQSHGERMAGEDGDAFGIVADQPGEALADFHGGVAIIGEGKDAARILASRPHQIGDAMDQYPCFSRTGTGQHQHIGTFAIIGDDPLLYRVIQGFDNGPPGFGRSLA